MSKLPPWQPVTRLLAVVLLLAVVFVTNKLIFFLSLSSAIWDHTPDTELASV